MIGYREARVHALVAAAILWTGAAIVTFGSPGQRNLAGHLKGEDFIQLYTLAHLAFEGEYPTLSDRERFHKRQVALVPLSAGDHYLPVYPPTAALLFRPFAWVPYPWAVTAWTMTTIVGYALVVWGTWRSVRNALPDRVFVARAAAAFPPFFLLVVYGQTTLIPLLAFFLGWLALAAGRPLLAGAALSFLSVKPQFALVIAVIVIVTGQWRVMSGGAFGLAAQLAIVVQIMGVQALTAYADTLSGIPAVVHLLEPDAWRMHSLRTLTNLVPGTAGRILWIALICVVIAVAVRTWRSKIPLAPRLGIVVIATVLVNPHLFGYDAALLVLPLLWLGGWVEQERADLRRPYWQSVYFLFVFLLFPTALVVRVQVSVLLLAWLFWRLSSAAAEHHQRADNHLNAQHVLGE